MGDQIPRKPGSKSFRSHLECGHCGRHHDPDRLQTLCADCSGPLLVRYCLDDPLMPDLALVLARPPSQFRFWEMMPTDAGPTTVTLGEGATPLIESELGHGLLIKDESQNPTGSFKARGMAVSIARNIELGARRFALPTNGNAGGAAAAYGARHGVDVDISMPANTPRPLIEEARALGASVTLVDGTIADAALEQAQRLGNDWLSVATLREPYRVEGKKMMGYELFWDLGQLPDVVLYPTGGGTGLVGMVKAFDEMEALGWHGPERPRMVAVQVASCAPIVRAFSRDDDHAEPWDDPGVTSAYGLRVPSAVGDRLMLEAIRGTRGTAIAVTEGQISDGSARLARDAGVWGSAEGGACVAAYDRLVAEGWVDPMETVVMFNTGSATKYL